MSTDLMLDIETLGTANNAHVLSVGAAWFDMKRPEEEVIQDTILIPSLVQPQSKIDTDTVTWWMAQSRDAQDILIGNHPRMENAQVAERVRDWAERARRIWAKDPDFDCVIMTCFIRNYLDPHYKWPFWKNRSVRTVLDIVPDTKDLPFEGTAHNALADATHQANQMRHAFAWLNPRT